MKVIIDGFKYDTETATLVMSYLLNESEKGELYRNRKYKFFCLHMLQSKGEKLEYDYKIIPITKQKAMDLLVDYEKIDEYEELFGEIPEPEGEDYVPPVPEIETDVDSDDYIIVEIPEPISLDCTENSNISEQENRVRPMRRVQRKLLSACTDNDFKAVQACLVCGALPKQRHIRRAIVSGNPDIVNLLLEESDTLKIGRKEIRLAVFNGDPEILNLILARNSKLKRYALKQSKKYLVVSIVESFNSS